VVPNEEMGHIFDELIRKFAEASNEAAGEHFTPRDVIELTVDILLAPESDTLAKKNVVRSVYDPTAGTCRAQVSAPLSPTRSRSTE